MDRRGFISGVGALAATAGAAVGVSDFVEAREAAAAKVRAAGLASSAGMPASAANTPMTPDTRFVDVAYIPDNAVAATRAASIHGRADASIRRRSLVTAVGPESWYKVTLSGLRRVRSLSAFQRLDVIARYAIDESPHFASFFAWSYVAGKVPMESAPIGFTVFAPDRAALEISYVLAAGATPQGGSATSGKLYFPIGGAGLAPGIYVMTTPSETTGVTPDLKDYSYSGYRDAPLSTGRGPPIDFDHFVFSITPHRG